MLARRALPTRAAALRESSTVGAALMSSASLPLPDMKQQRAAND